jgi:hypothetical protein
MAYVLVQHKVARWSDFEPVLRDDGERRRKLGSKGGKVLRNLQDPENVFVLFEWDTVEGANQFANGLETHEAMEWATSGTWSRIFVTEELFEVDA